MAPSFYTDVELYDAEPHIGCSIVFFSKAVYIFLEFQAPATIMNFRISRGGGLFTFFKSGWRVTLRSRNTKEMHREKQKMASSFYKNKSRAIWCRAIHWLLYFILLYAWVWCFVLDQQVIRYHFCFSLPNSALLCFCLCWGNKWNSSIPWLD